MKKQYLISLLGLIAIFIPFGSSLLNSSTKPLSYSAKEDAPPSGTGLSVTDNSNITFWDMDGSGNVDEEDETKSFFLEVEFTSANWNQFSYAISDFGNEGLTLYSSIGSNEKKLVYDISYKELNEITNASKKWNDEFHNGNYIISSDDISLTNSKFAKYVFTTGETFEIAADYNKPKAPQEPVVLEETIIEEIPLIPNSEIKETTIDNISTNIENDNRATVNYTINPGKNVKGELLLIEKVEWLDYNDNEKQLGINSDNNINEPSEITTNSEMLEANKTYDNTKLVATMKDKEEDSESTKIADVDSFKTNSTPPEILEPNAVKVDTDDDILEIQGEIKTNGSIIKQTDIQIIQIKNQSSSKVETYVNSWEISNDTITYDIWTDQYFLDYNDRSEWRNEGVSSYSLEVNYILQNEKKTSNTSETYYLNEIKIWEITRREDLSYLKPDTSSIKFEPGEIAGITIGVLFVAGFILAGTIILIGNILFKRIEN